METLYRKVSVSERLPEKEGKYYIIDITGELNKAPFRGDEFHSWQPSKYWLEEIPDNTQPQPTEKLPSKLLREYFKNTPREQVLKDWESTSDYDNVNSPKVLELFEAGKGEIDVEKLAEEFSNKIHAGKYDHYEAGQQIGRLEGFIEGFKKAMELNSNQ